MLGESPESLMYSIGVACAVQVNEGTTNYKGEAEDRQQIHTTQKASRWVGFHHLVKVIDIVESINNRSYLLNKTILRSYQQV